MPRPAAPVLIAGNARAWGISYKSARIADDKHKFRWPAGCYDEVRETLRLATLDHCAFCDGYLGVTSPVTVEHFLPKAKFPRAAFHWANLYPCCYQCQMAKGQCYKHGLLRPDVLEYEFHKFFLIDYSTGKIDPIPSLPRRDLRRAQITIELYGLNSAARNAARLEALDEANSSRPVSSSSRNFRYLFD